MSDRPDDLGEVEVDRAKKVPVHDKRRIAASEAPTAAVESPPEHSTEELLESLQRLQAEFDNYRKRMMKEQSAISERGAARLVERLLPVLDDLERAVEHGAGSGVDLVLKHLRDALAQEGLEEVPAEQGGPFDPTIHEAVDSREVAKAEAGPVVVDLYRRGYRLRDKLLRPAMVVVGHATVEPASED